jgi:anti-anti-sigma regulatory factor
MLQTRDPLAGVWIDRIEHLQMETEEDEVAVEVSVRELNEAVEVSLSGVLDDDLMSRLGDSLKAAVASPGRATILNLDDVTLVSRAGVEALVAPLCGNDGNGSVSVVCRRGSAAQLLRRWGLAQMVSIHHSLDDALAEVRRSTLARGDCAESEGGAGMRCAASAELSALAEGS